MPLIYHACFSFVLRPPRQLFLIVCPPTLNRCMLLLLTRYSGQYSSPTHQLFPQHVPPSLPAVPASIPFQLTSCSPSTFLHPYPLFRPLFLSNSPAVPPACSSILTHCSGQYSSQNLPVLPRSMFLQTYPLSPPIFLSKLTSCPLHIPQSLPAVPASMPRNSGWLISP
jgi:hypothetical protein